MKSTIKVALVMALGLGFSTTSFAKKHVPANEKPSEKRKVAQVGNSPFLSQVVFKKGEKSGAFFKQASKVILSSAKYDEGFGPFDNGCVSSPGSDVYLCQIEMIEPGGTRYLAYITSEQKAGTGMSLQDFFPIPMPADYEP